MLIKHLRPIRAEMGPPDATAIEILESTGSPPIATTRDRSRRRQDHLRPHPNHHRLPPFSTSPGKRSRATAPTTTRHHSRPISRLWRATTARIPTTTGCHRSRPPPPLRFGRVIHTTARDRISVVSATDAHLDVRPIPTGSLPKSASGPFSSPIRDRRRRDPHRLKDLRRPHDAPPVPHRSQPRWHSVRDHATPSARSSHPQFCA